MPALPRGTFDHAMRAHLEVMERRVNDLYVRPRALFAEAVVAALVDGTVVEFPACAWDVRMPLRGYGRPVRIQVKCSGEQGAHSEKKMPASWGKLREPSSGKDEEFGVLPGGFHCDVFVFARHEGDDIRRGWRFYVLSQNKVRKAVQVNPSVDQHWLEGLGARSLGPSELKTGVAKTVRGMSIPASDFSNEAIADPRWLATITVTFGDRRRGTVVADAHIEDKIVQQIESVGRQQARRGRGSKTAP